MIGVRRQSSFLIPEAVRWAAAQAVGIKEVEEGIWLVSFMQYDLGYIDLEEKTLQPSTTLLAPKCTLCLRNVL